MATVDLTSSSGVVTIDTDGNPADFYRLTTTEDVNSWVVSGEAEGFLLRIARSSGHTVSFSGLVDSWVNKAPNLLEGQSVLIPMVQDGGNWIGSSPKLDPAEISSQSINHASAAPLAINAAVAHRAFVTLTGNVTGLSFLNMEDGDEVTVYFKASGGSRMVDLSGVEAAVTISNPGNVSLGSTSIYKATFERAFGTTFLSAVEFVTASNAITFSTDLPSVLDRVDGDQVNVTAVWNLVRPYQVEYSDNDGSTWQNASGAGSSGTANSTSFGSDVTVVDGRQYRIKVTSAGVDFYSSISTLNVSTSGDAPVLVTFPKIDGDPSVGSVITVTTGTYTADPAATLTYQWLRNGSPIAGATGTTYTTVLADANTQIDVRETATNTEGSITTRSAGITIIGEGVYDFNTAGSTPNYALNHTINLEDITTSLRLGDSICFIITGIGPSYEPNLTYTHPNGDVILNWDSNNWRPRLKIIKVDYTGQFNFAFSSNSYIRVSWIPLRNCGAITASTPASNDTPVNPGAVIATDNSIGYQITTANHMNGTFATPAGHTQLSYTGSAILQTQISKLAIASAGVYDPPASTYTPTASTVEQATSVSLVAHVEAPATSPTTGGGYLWENRNYIEPNPNAAAGTPEKLKAQELGITTRITVSSLSAFLSAMNAAGPGTQIYVSQTISGSGSGTMIPWYGSTPGTGPLSGGAVMGAGGAPDGTAQNPIMVTCAPNAWIQNGTIGSSTDSRCIAIRGTAHVWLYGANFRNAKFPVQFGQCPGVAGAPMRMWHCKVTNAGHASVQFAGYWKTVNTSGGDLAATSGGKYGYTRYADARYNEVSWAGRNSDEFGEGIYVGQGSSTSYKAITCHNVDIIANLFHNLPAEASEFKPGTYNCIFADNLIRDCNDTGTRTGDPNIGLPGALHVIPPNNGFGTYDALSSYNPNIKVLRNRWVRITSASAKFPPAMVLIGHRGVTVAGNVFEQVSIPGVALIQLYSVAGHWTGSQGSIQVHNNSSSSSMPLVNSRNAGNHDSERNNMLNNFNASNNIGLSSQTGTDLVVSTAAFVDDGSGHECSTFAPAPGGALSGAGSNTTAHWGKDFAGNDVTVPVNPGAYQLAS